MPEFIKNAGVWKPDTSWVRDGAVWKKPAQAFARDLGVWKPYRALPFSCLFTSSLQKATGGTAVTYTAMGIGTADASRLVACVVHWTVGGASNLNSATIGGVAATIVAQNDGTNTGTAVISALVPTGTTANVVLNFSVSVAQSAVGVWSILNPVSTTAYHFHAPAGGGSASRSVTLNIPAGGAALVGTEGDAASITYTNAIEAYDTSISSHHSTGASAETAVLLTGQVITANPCRVIIGASWA